MQPLRNATMLVRFVLAWFALSIGVAVASPIVKPQAMELVCSGGAMKLLIKAGPDGEPGKVSSSHTLDCPLCATMDTPPQPACAIGTPPQPLAHAVQPLPAARIAALTGLPPQSRAPPL